VLCAPIVLSTKCSSQKKGSPQSGLLPKSALPYGISENLLYPIAIRQKKMFLNKFVLRGSILKIFQDIATFHPQKYLFDLLFSEKIVPTFTFSKAVFRKNCTNIF